MALVITVAAMIFLGEDGGGWICRNAPEPRKLSGSKDPAMVA
jgi:hypothetical protein